MKTLLTILTVIFFCHFNSCQNKNQKLFSGETDKIKQSEGDDYFYLSHSFPYGKIDYEAHRKAAQSFKKYFTITKSQTTAWEFAGPVNVGGRVTDIEFDPSNNQIVYLAAAFGGVFKSNDGGLNWTPVFDNEISLSIGDIAIAPSNPNIIYVGTGEPNGGSGSLTYEGNGIYKSINGGTTWTNVGLQNTHMTGHLSVHPTNPDIVFAACMGDMYGATPDRGLYKTIDGGTNWTKVLFVDDSTGAIDVVINPVDPNIVFAATWKRSRYPNAKDYAGEQSGLWKSVDGGNTFARLGAPEGLPPVGAEYSRIAVDLCESSPNVVYCMYIDDIYEFKGIYKSIDNGNNWSQTNDTSIISSGGGGQFYWYGRLKCEPGNPDVLYVIGFEIYKTIDGGNTYNPTFQNAHVDQHAVAINPLDPGNVLIGNDGGLFLSQDSGNTWVHNETLPISQIYRAEIDYSNPTNLYFGFQDNGTYFTPTGSVDDYFQVFGGDGFQPLVDRSGSGTFLAGSQYGFIYKFDSTGGFPSSQNGIFGAGNWNYPLTGDPQNANTIYSGTQQVFQSFDFGTTWNSISPDLTSIDTTGNLIFGTITYIDVSPINSNIIYAGTDDGKVWNTLNGGLQWNQLNGLPLRWVTCVRTDAFDEHTAYVTLSGYRFHDNISHVYKTTDDGQHWTDISSNLPDIPCNSIVSDPSIPGLLYLATDVGVYFSDVSGNWYPMAPGMPVVVCSDLRLHQPTRTLVVGTFGRSAYKIDLNNFVGVNNVSAGIVDVSIFPNPVVNHLSSLQFTVSRSEKADVTVYNIAGIKFFETTINALSGKNILPIDFKNASPGIYILKLDLKSGSVFRKLVVN
jgi:photosystem II stability/assembly factor-like uncharacterized protein